MRLLLVTPVALAAACFAACGDDGDSSEPGPATADLEGRTLLVTSINEDGAERPVVEGTEIRIAFDEGSLGAQAGCNSMGGRYVIAGDVLVVEDLSTTEMGCEPRLMDQDAWVADLLLARPTVAVDGAGVTLTTGQTVVELADRDVVRPDAPLVGTVWVLDTIFEGGPDGAASSVPGGVEASVTFADDGTFGIDTGCNSGSGTYEETGDGTLQVGGATVTAIGCGGDVAVVESAMLALFAAGEVTAEVDDQRLTLTADAAGLGFRASP